MKYLQASVLPDPLSPDTTTATGRWCRRMVRYALSARAKMESSGPPSRVSEAPPAGSFEEEEQEAEEEGEEEGKEEEEDAAVAVVVEEYAEALRGGGQKNDAAEIE